MKKSIKWLASIGLITAMTIMLSLLFSSKVFAWMPSLQSGNPTTGIFPQVYLQNRAIVLPEERWSYLTKQWQGTITGGNILCGDQGKAIRSGHFDPTIYYAEDVGPLTATFNEAVSAAMDTYKHQVEQIYAYKDNVSVIVSESHNLDSRFNRNEFAFLLLFFHLY